MAGGGSRDARRRAPTFTPEPLHLPIEAPYPRPRVPPIGEEGDESGDSSGGEVDDRAGTHVIVIDLA